MHMDVCKHNLCWHWKFVLKLESVRVVEFANNRLSYHECRIFKLFDTRKQALEYSCVRVI